MAKDEAKEKAGPKGVVAPAQMDEAQLTDRVRNEVLFIEKRREEVKAANKEISGAFDRLDGLGLDKSAVKAFLKRRKLDAEQRKRFDRTVSRLNQMDLFEDAKEAA